MQPTIGCDLDGCVSDFHTGYMRLIKEISGIELPPVSETYPDQWYYERAAGLLRRDEDRVWNCIKASTEFWRGLLPHEGAISFLEQLAELPLDTYFITHRRGLGAKEQSEDWLQLHGYDWTPTVLLTGQKGSVCKALGVTHYLDDKVENVIDVREWSPETKCYMLSRPWNRPVNDVPRIPDLQTFLDEVRKDM